MKIPVKDEITVLLVDDNEKFLEDTSLILKRNGYYVKKASSGFEAIYIIERENYQVAVISQDMLPMSGEETTLLIRELQSKITLPILFLVEDQSEESLKQAKDFGINDYAIRSNINEMIKKISKLAKIHELVEEKLRKKTKKKSA